MLQILTFLRENIDSVELGDPSFAKIASCQASLGQKRSKKVKNRFFEVYKSNTTRPLGPPRRGGVVFRKFSENEIFTSPRTLATKWNFLAILVLFSEKVGFFASFWRISAMFENLLHCESSMFQKLKFWELFSAKISNFENFIFWNFQKMKFFG